MFPGQACLIPPGRQERAPATARNPAAARRGPRGRRAPQPRIRQACGSKPSWSASFSTGMASTPGSRRGRRGRAGRGTTLHGPRARRRGRAGTRAPVSRPPDRPRTYGRRGRTVPGSRPRRCRRSRPKSGTLAKAAAMPAPNASTTQVAAARAPASRPAAQTAATLTRISATSICEKACTEIEYEPMTAAGTARTGRREMPRAKKTTGVAARTRPRRHGASGAQNMPTTLERDQRREDALLGDPEAAVRRLDDRPGDRRDGARRGQYRPAAGRVASP